MRARSDQQVDRGGLFDIARQTHSAARLGRTADAQHQKDVSTTMPTLERMKDKHNDQVKQLAKVSAKRDKLITSLVRVEFQRVALIRAVARSSKRLDKARSVASLNAPLPSTESLDLGSLTPKQADKVIAVTLAELPATDAGKANAKSWDAIPAVRKAKAKRPRGHADLTDFANTFPKAVRESLEDSRKADAAKAKPQVSDVTNIPVSEFLGHGDALADRLPGDNKPVRAMPKYKRKPRRTPDDFKADMARK
jgi:hypothetical protein